MDKWIIKDKDKYGTRFKCKICGARILVFHNGVEDGMPPLKCPHCTEKEKENNDKRHILRSYILYVIRILPSVQPCPDRCRSV